MASPVSIPTRLGWPGQQEADLRIHNAKLKLTRPRIASARLLFSKGDRHFCAEQLHEEVLASGVEMSLATVYNTLRSFCEAGIIRVLPIGGKPAYFDTDVSDHQHFYIEGKADFINTGRLRVSDLPELPAGMEVVKVDIVIRLKPSPKA